MDKKSILENKKVTEGIIICLISMFFISESLKLHRNESWALSPALFPLIITISILLLSISLILKGLRENNISTNLGKKENYKTLGLIILISLIVNVNSF